MHLPADYLLIIDFFNEDVCATGLLSHLDMYIFLHATFDFDFLDQIRCSIVNDPLFFLIGKQDATDEGEIEVIAMRPSETCFSKVCFGILVLGY